ncbi:hypothetical protein [Marinomonas flavescens]|uniref:hypothetical protein n=1 Tax=Marinomonas flavescens TaxID=2529379 RepID=UPI0010542D28|nr:hypothetical protein [Marinomonas flavescens]
MNTFTKSALTLLAASSIATMAFAAPGDATYGKSVRSQISSLGLESQTQNFNVDLNNNAAFAPTIKASEDNAHRAEFLQNQIN